MIPLEHQETRPEKYLREIRDLQEQNQILLKKLVEAEEHKNAQWKWGAFGKIAMILLPYFFSIFVAWAFYAKVQNTFEDLKETIVSIPSSLSGNFSENVSNFSSTAKEKIDSVAEKLKQRKSTNSGNAENVNDFENPEESGNVDEEASSSSGWEEKWQEVKNGF